MSFLTISHLEKSYGANRVVKDFNLSIEKGEFISLLGPSGCGKTTVLRMLAGFEVPTSGTIEIDGKDVVGIKTANRNVGMMFQAYALFPNMTVADNVGFGLKVAGVPRAEREARVKEMLRLISLPDLGSRYPFQLSGGQQQRVALARALAPQPRVLLLDEPLSALDAKVRVSLRNEIRDIQRELGITAIFVTHDQEEALSISDRIVVINGGIAEQVGTPFEIYNQPETAFVASFVGTLSVLAGKVEDKANGVVVVDGSRFERITLRDTAGNGDSIRLALRPEALRVTERDGDIALEGRIREVHFLGSVIRVLLEVGAAELSLDMFNDPTRPPPKVGQALKAYLAPGSVLTLPA
ncbi:MAG: ABC transporter ATP-binding protein [Nitratireductor sp.]|nr:ABC transporter ATP-binding protein [Nitratireductor sp.]